VVPDRADHRPGHRLTPGWVGDHAMGHRMMLRNLAAVAPNYLDAGIAIFVVACFVRDADALRSVRQALGCRCGWFACRWGGFDPGRGRRHPVAH
jgi:hypothetical protein